MTILVITLHKENTEGADFGFDSLEFSLSSVPLVLSVIEET